MIHMELSNDVRLRYDTAHYLAELAPHFGVPDDKRNELCFLLEATFDLRSEQLGSADATLTVDVCERNAELVISVTDKGLPYIPSERQLSIFNNAKLGRLTFEQLGADGQRLSFHLDQEPSYVMPAPPETVEEVLEDSEVTCRRTTTDPEDILEAIRCLYEVYGYNYMHQSLYHSDEFARMLKGGRYVSALAVNAHGQALGHAALEEHEWFGGLREVCNLVVKPMARGLGISKKLCSYLVDLAVSEGTGNIYGLPVLHHPISQKLFNHADFVPCGLYANLMDLRDIGGYEDREGRASAAACVRKVVSAGEPTLYLPEECAGFVGDVLAEAQMGWVAGTGSGDEGIPRETQLSYSIDSVHSYAEVKVDSIGADLRDRLMALYEELVASGSSASLVHLNARDPRCPECYDALRAWGLSFMGCLPGGRDGDYLLLEHLVGDGFDKAAAVTEPNYARMLERLYEINGW